MRIGTLADLHFDNWHKAGRDPLAGCEDILAGLDALFLLGDLSNQANQQWPRVFSALRKVIDPEKIYVIPGNHDYYGQNLLAEWELSAICANAGVHYAQRRSFRMDGMRILCCTLWSDFALRGRLKKDMRSAKILNDYRYIYIGNDISARDCSPADTRKLHMSHRRWLARKLAQPHEGKTMVLTHHCPHPALAGPFDPLTPSFTSDLGDLIEAHQPDYWYFGHTHRRTSEEIGTTLLRNVSLGHPLEMDSERVRAVLMSGIVDTASGPVTDRRTSLDPHLNMQVSEVGHERRAS